MEYYHARYYVLACSINLSNQFNYVIVLNFFKTYGASMCSRGQNKNTQIANKSRVRSRYAVNSLHDLCSVLKADGYTIPAYTSNPVFGLQRKMCFFHF